MTSAMIVAPQLVVAIAAPWIGYLSELWGRKPLLLASFAVQIIRAVLFVFIDNSILLITVQTLDGISGAIRSVLTIVIVADLTTGTGRFNLANGVVGLVFTVAASVSTTIFGFIAQEMGHGAAFMGMAAMAGAGGLVVWLLLDETKPSKYVD
jgi:MFS family permease